MAARRDDIDIGTLLNLDFRRIMNICRTDPDIDDICKNPEFWIAKIQIDFPNERIDRRNPALQYKRLYWYNKLSQPCKEFHQNPSINPYTHRKVLPHGLAYRHLLSECGDPHGKTAEPLCKQFLRSPIKDPFQRKPIQLYGTGYNNLVKECGEPYEHRKLTDCQKFIRNPNVNPRSGLEITKDGQVYNKLWNECHPYQSFGLDFINEFSKSLSRLKLGK